MVVKKAYYSISEVEKMLEIPQSKIRYWEKEFKQFVRPKRSRRGDRMFSEKDIENLKQIKHLVQELGFTLEGAKQYMKHHKKELDPKMAVIDKLNKIKKMLEDMRDSID